MINAVQADVFDAHGQTGMNCADAGNAAAHQPAAQHTDTFDWPGLRLSSVLFFSAVEAKNRLRSAADSGVMASSPKARASAA